MDIINPIEFRLMVSMINRRPHDIDYVKGCLDETFTKQIGAVHTFVGVTDSEPKSDELHLYDKVEVEVPAPGAIDTYKTINGWRRKPVANSTNPKEIFGYFKFMLENIESIDIVFDPLGKNKTLVIPKIPRSTRLVAPADKIVLLWIEEKERQLQDEPEQQNITLESFFIKDAEKCVAFIEQEVKVAKRPVGKNIAVMVAAFEKLGCIVDMSNRFSEFHDLLKKRFGGRIATRQAAADYYGAYKNSDSDSSKQIRLDEIEITINRLKQI